MQGNKDAFNLHIYANDVVVSPDELIVFNEKLKSNNQKELINTAKNIAELAKRKNNRDVLTKQDLIKALADLYIRENGELSYNCARALGNIFYENEEGVNLLTETDLKKILNFFCLVNVNEFNLIAKTSGMLLNVFICNEELLKTVKISHYLQHCLEILTNDTFHEELFLHILSTITLCFECEVEFEEVMYEEINNSILEVLEKSDYISIDLACIKILNYGIEKMPKKDDFSLELAQSDAFTKILNYAETFFSDSEDSEKEDEDPLTPKAVSDLIINNFIYVEAADYHFGEGTGCCYLQLKEWLNSSNLNLLEIAILCIGNIAINDTNATRLAQDGMIKTLIDIINQDESLIKTHKMQYAILGCLKNLTVPENNKPIFWQYGLSNVINKFFYQTKELDEIIAFKVLGLFRLALKGQEQPAKDFLAEKVIEKLENWYKKYDKQCIKSEICRIFACLIKSCKDSQASKLVIRSKFSLHCFLELFMSNHESMQMEAITSFAILRKVLLFRSVEDQKNFYKLLMEEEIGKTIYIVYKEKFSTWNKQRQDEMQAIVNWLASDKDVLAHFEEHKFFIRKKDI